MNNSPNDEVELTPQTISIGMKVKFHTKVYGKFYSPYYDTYRDHVFEVLRIENEHVELKCVDDVFFKMQGWPHIDELVQV